MQEMARSLSKISGGGPPYPPSRPLTFSKGPVQTKVIENPDLKLKCSSFGGIIIVLIY